MKCSNCSKKFDDNLEECPFCHTPTNFLELPKLKENITISNDNEIVTEESENISDEKEILENDVFSSDNNIKKRKLFFFKVILVTIVICLGLLLFLYFRKNNDTNVSYDQQLTNYYNSYSTNDAKKLLEVINNNEDIIIQVQTKTKGKLNIDIDKVSKKTYSSHNLLLEEIEKIKKDINNLYNIYVLNNKKDKVKVISNDNYNELMMKLDKISKDSELYYLIIDFYNDKEYDEVARLINGINEDNYYYTESRKYLELSTNVILKLIEVDINKMSQGIDSLSEEDKKDRYHQIYLVIDSYNKLYSNLNLASNLKYQDLLNNYRK